MTHAPYLVAGSANRALADAIAREVGVSLAPAVIERFPDGEVHINLQESPAGRGVFFSAGRGGAPSAFFRGFAGAHSGSPSAASRPSWIA